MTIREEKVMLTPAMAESLLATNYEKQRNLNIGYARALANDIEGGRWQSNVLRDYIEVSDTGKLMNGQHRCKAVIFANTPIMVGIRYGVPESQFIYIDGGKARTVNQFVKNHYATVLSTLGRYVSAIEAGMPIASALKGTTGNVSEGKKKQTVLATRQEVLECISKHEKDFELCAEQGQRIYRAIHGGSKSDFAFALWIIGSVYGYSQVTLFVDEVAANLPTSEAIAIGKSKGSKQIIEAKAKHVTVDNKFWVALVLSMYDGWKTNSRFKQKWVEASIEKYNLILADRRRCM